MTADELKLVQELLGFSNPQFCAVLRTPLRTLEDWRSGKNRIPGIAEVAILLLAGRRGISAARLRELGVKVEDVCTL